MATRKVYGSYQKASCPYCGGTATTKNQIGVPTCVMHASTDCLEIKCTCGAWLDIKEGKYGTFFLCENCGPVSFAKAMTMKSITSEQVTKEKQTEQISKSKETKTHTTARASFNQKSDTSSNCKETFITTDDIEYFS